MDILTAYEKQPCYGLIVVVFAADSFEQDKACEYKRCTAYGQVIAYPVEFLPEFQKRFAGFKTAFTLHLGKLIYPQMHIMACENDDIPGYFIFSATMFKNTVYMKVCSGL